MQLELIYSPFKVSIWRSIIVATNLFVRESSNSNTWAEFSSNKFLLPRRGKFMWICHTKVPLPPRGENYRTKFSSIVLNMQGILYPCIISRDVLLRIIFLAKKLGLELAVGVRLEVLCHTHVSSLLQNVSTWRCTHHPCLTRSARSKSCARYDFRNNNVTGVWDWSRKASNILPSTFY